MTNYCIGQTVRYANPEPGEETMTFTLLEDNGDRVLIQASQRDFPHSRILQTEVVAKSDIELVMAWHRPDGPGNAEACAQSYGL